MHRPPRPLALGLVLSLATGLVAPALAEGEAPRRGPTEVVAAKLYPAGATTNSDAGVTDLRKTYKTLEAMQKAGMLLDGSGLQPSAKGWRIKYSGNKRAFVDGPFVETKELVAGYTLIQVRSRDEAIEWSRRFPNPTPDGSSCEIEVRQLFEAEDFTPANA